MYREMKTRVIPNPDGHYYITKIELWWLNKEEETDEVVSCSNVVFGRMERDLGLKLCNCLTQEMLLLGY